MERFGLTGRACQYFKSAEATYPDSPARRLGLVRGGGRALEHLGPRQGGRRPGLRPAPGLCGPGPGLHPALARRVRQGPELPAHDVFFTVGLNIGTPHSDHPGLRHPVAPAPPAGGRRISGPVGSTPRAGDSPPSLRWIGYSDLATAASGIGSKERSSGAFAELPAVAQEFEVALRDDRGAEDPSVRLLRDRRLAPDRGRSRITDLDRLPGATSRGPGGDRHRQERLCQGAPGWFSDRARTHYLASGKPALAQATGFERCVPTGRGCSPSRPWTRRSRGPRRINRDYEEHCRPRREFAEEHLDRPEDSCRRCCKSRQLDAWMRDHPSTVRSRP